MATSLTELKKELEAARDGLLAQTAPLHAKADALRAKIQPLEDELRAVNQEIKRIEQPGLNAISRDIAGIARAMGARTLVNGEPAAPPEPPPETPPAS